MIKKRKPVKMSTNSIDKLRIPLDGTPYGEIRKVLASETSSNLKRAFGWEAPRSYLSSASMLAALKELYASDSELVKDIIYNTNPFKKIIEFVKSWFK
jgi:hypothetical protein